MKLHYRTSERRRSHSLDTKCGMTSVSAWATKRADFAIWAADPNRRGSCCAKCLRGLAAESAIEQPTETTARPSGPSGAHKAPRFLFSFESDEQRDRWQRAAEASGETLAGWLRRIADAAARD